MENLYDGDCLFWCLRYKQLVDSMADVCCKKEYCLWKTLAGGLQSPKESEGPNSAAPPQLPNQGGPSDMELFPVPPCKQHKKAVDLPEGTYVCKKFAVVNVGGKNRLLLLLVLVAPTEEQEQQLELPQISTNSSIWPHDTRSYSRQWWNRKATTSRWPISMETG